jgi:hypothetical protein
VTATPQGHQPSLSRRRFSPRSGSKPIVKVLTVTVHATKTRKRR